MNKSDRTRYLAFSLGKEEYAIPLLTVREVIGVPEVTRVPHSPSHFLGIMNLRGQVISVIDLRMKFGMKPEAGAETAVIICDLSPVCLGVVVNCVNSVLSLSKEDIQEKPDLPNQKQSEYIQGVVQGKSGLVLILDIARALDVAAYQQVHAAAHGKKAA